MSMEVKIRQAVERAIAARVVNDLLSADYVIAVNNGEEDVYEGRDVKEILGAMFSTDEDLLYAGQYMPGGGVELRGWVKFIYGNYGWDVVSDYTTNLEGALEPARRLSDEFERDPVRALLQEYKDTLRTALDMVENQNYPAEDLIRKMKELME